MGAVAACELVVDSGIITDEELVENVEVAVVLDGVVEDVEGVGVVVDVVDGAIDED